MCDGMPDASQRLRLQLQLDFPYLLGRLCIADSLIGILIKDLSAANVDAMHIAGIDVLNSIVASSTQLEQITQIVRADSEFPRHKWRPTIFHLFWMRPSFPARPFVVVRFGNPQYLNK